MPSEHIQATKASERPVHPEYRDALGEDPARFLCTDMSPYPRIRGLESVALVDAYLDVETDRDTPRKGVVAALNQRKDALEEGEA